MELVMKEYFYKSEELINYLKSQPEDQTVSWIYDFLQYGHTSPLFGVPSELYRSVFIEHLYLSSEDKVWRQKLRAAVKEIYKMTPLSEYESYMIIELLKCIALLNITDLKQDLYKEALIGTFKNKKSPFLPNFIDLHTIILKALFGLTHDTGEISDSINIAERDISDPMYMLECFHFLILTQGNSMKYINYLPGLLQQCAENKRGYFEAVEYYLKLFTKENILKIISDMDSILQDKKLISTFQKILSHIGILFRSTDEEDNEERISLVKYDKLNIFLYIYTAQVNDEILNTLRIPDEEHLKEISLMCA